jgi:thymidylate synthase (FAD)
VYVVAHTDLEPGFIDYLNDYKRGWPSGYEDKNYPIIDEDHPGDILPEFAGRVCYDSFGGKAGRKTNKSYIKHIIEVGHGSVLEHASVTFLIRGVSRGFTHELVRHRVGTAFSQASTRYCDGDSMDTVLPQLLLSLGDQELIDEYENALCSIREAYKYVLERTQSVAEAKAEEMGYDLTKRGERVRLRKNVRSCARSLLPIGTEAPITFSANYRTLRHIFVARGAPAAELEIRRVVLMMLEEMQSRAPHCFGDFEVYDVGDGTRACRTQYPKV